MEGSKGNPKWKPFLTKQEHQTFKKLKLEKESQAGGALYTNKRVILNLKTPELYMEHLKEGVAQHTNTLGAIPNGYVSNVHRIPGSKYTEVNAFEMATGKVFKHPEETVTYLEDRANRGKDVSSTYPLTSGIPLIKRMITTSTH